MNAFREKRKADALYMPHQVMKQLIEGYYHVNLSSLPPLTTVTVSERIKALVNTTYPLQKVGTRLVGNPCNS